MKPIVGCILAAVFLTACNSPKDIILGPDPLTQIAEQGDQFRKLSEDDRKLLVGYLAAQTMRTTFSKEPLPTIGKTVGEVLTDAGKWREQLKSEEAEQAKRDAEAEALRKKVAAEAAKVAEQLATMVTIAVTGKTVHPKDYDVGRYSPLLMVKYALVNNTDKHVKQIKGRVYFSDPTGDPIGDLDVEFNNKIAPGATVKTDTGLGWKLNDFRRGEIEKIAERDFDAMTGRFAINSIAFADGSVIKTPE